jgi:Response receiver domain
MSHTAESFSARCSQAAERFLQTVVVIDNQAELGDRRGNEEPRTASKARTQLLQPDFESIAMAPREQFRAVPDATSTPVGGGAAVLPVKELQHIVEPTPAAESERGHELNAKELADAFSDRSILCTVYKPVPGEEMVERAAKIASHADVVVVDWHLEPGSSLKAKEIIAEILRADDERNGRLRLIALYTAQPGLPDLAKELHAHLNRPSLILQSADSTELEAPGVRIVFIQKAGRGAERPVGGVAEEDIPKRLVEEFAKLNAGVFPSIALQSIAAIREGSHHLLATFHAGLDAALILHRCFLPCPEDSEAFAMNLISAELASLLAARDVGGTYAGIDAQRDWVAAKWRSGKAFPVGALTISQNDVSLWLDQRPTNIPGQGKNKSNYDVLAEALYGDAKVALEQCYEFARISGLKREAYGRRSLLPNRPPVLGLGTILRPIPNEKGELPRDLNQDTFLLCTQPTCDSVRIKGKRSYPFQRVMRNTDLFNTVVKLKDETNATLLIKWSPFLTEMFTFASASAREDFVLATWDAGCYVFGDFDGNRFEWLADLKDLTAQWAVSQIGARISSVGIDPFEWLRRKGNAKANDD